MLDTRSWKLRLVFEEPLLGAVAADPEAYGKYQMVVDDVKVGKPDELGFHPASGVVAEPVEGEEAVEPVEIAEETTPGLFLFLRVPQNEHTRAHMEDPPALLNHVIKGFAKAAAQMCKEAGGVTAKLTAYRQKIDGLVHVYPRLIPIQTAGPVYHTVRPLRGQTAKGERITRATSETVPEGSTIEFTLTVLGDKITEEMIREWFDYGAWRGLGQWRNAEWGRFTVVEFERVPTPSR